MNTRKRNFTEPEKALLLQILLQYKHIVENKRTDNASVKMKRDAWASIADKYNSSQITNELATGSQLNRLWLNIKYKQRQQQSATGEDARGVSSVEDVSSDCSLWEEALEADISNQESQKLFSHLLRPSLGIKDDEVDSGMLMAEACQSEVDITREVLPTASTPVTVSRKRTSSQPSDSLARLTFSQRQVCKTERPKKPCITREIQEGQRRANELHELEKKILYEKLREAKARADLAEWEFMKKTL